MERERIILLVDQKTPQNLELWSVYRYIKDVFIGS